MASLGSTLSARDSGRSGSCMSLSGPVCVGGHTSITGVSRLARAVSTDEVVQVGRIR
jgi:hypothetical protein